MTAPVAQVLRDAAELIERDGWCQGDMYSTAGARCVMGAIFTTAHHALPDDPSLAIDALAPFARSLPQGKTMEWNDDPDRTVTEVLAALRACADEQDEDHTAAAVATGQSLGDEPWQHHDGEVIAMHDEQEASDG